MKKFIIIGLTKENQRFRPSDWADRLADVMSSFRPPGPMSMHSIYSPYVIPGTHQGNRCLVVDYRLRDLEPRAWKFLVDFAADNNLQTDELESKHATVNMQTPA